MNDGSMMGGPPQDQSMGGFAQPPYDPHASQGMMQGQYPSGAVMTTFNGQGGGPADSHAGGSAHDAHGGGHVGINAETGECPRRCTDIQCCFMWLVFTITLFTLMMMSRWYGDVSALTHGRDYYGRICGISAGVENQPWLYWCRDDPVSVGIPAKLNMIYPSCVAACPVSSNVSVPIPCLREAQVAPGLIPGGQFGNVKTQEVRMQESLVQTAPYPTTPRGGRFCMPTDGKLRLSLLDDWNALHPFGRIMRMVNAGTLGMVGWIFFIVTLTAIILGYFFFFCIKNCPKTLTMIFVYPSAALCGLVAIWMFLALFVLIDKDSAFADEYQAKMNPLYQHYSWTNASYFSLGASAVLTAVTLMLVGMGMNFDGASVGDLINAGMGCMKDVPGMYYLPVIEGLVKWLIFLFFVDGLRWFFTVGDLHKNRIHVNGARFAGLSREWNWNHWWIIAVAIWVIGFAWFMEITNALFQYLISKSAMRWYFTEKINHKKKMAGSPLPTALCEAMTYHWGSIAYGAFWIPTWRPTRLLYWATSTVGPSAGTPTTAMGKLMGCCSSMTCGCCGLQGCCGLTTNLKEAVQSDEACIKDGFTDIAIRANDFPAASQKAHMLLEHSHKVVQYMYRDQSQTTLCVLGVTTIATVCAWVAFMITNFAKIYIEPDSQLYIANNGLVVFLSWILGAYVAFGFMSAWDHTADTLLYCYAWNRKCSRNSVNKYIPDSVRQIVGFDDMEQDRYPYYGRAKSQMYLKSWIDVGGGEGQKKKVVDEKRNAPPVNTPQPSWFNAGSWMGSQPPMQAPPGSMPNYEMQSLIPK